MIVIFVKNRVIILSACRLSMKRLSMITTDVSKAREGLFLWPSRVNPLHYRAKVCQMQRGRRGYDEESECQGASPLKSE